jgi:Cu2+-exporting ATPase
MADPAAQSPASGDSGASLIAFCHGDRQAVLTIRQTLRPDAIAIVEILKAQGHDVRIMSGDRPGAVAPIAATLRISGWQAALKPADKIAALDALKAEGRRVLMVGDGLNDTPALAAAYVSLSPISAVDLAQAQADAVFLGERLQPVMDTLVIARQARRLMLQNLVLAVAYNAVAVPIAIAGLVTPLIAAVAMSGSSLLVTLNALRARLPASPHEAVPQTTVPTNPPILAQSGTPA